MTISGTIIGYDPGGNGHHGIAKLAIDQGIVREARTETLQTVEQVIQLVQVKWGTGLNK